LDESYAGACAALEWALESAEYKAVIAKKQNKIKFWIIEQQTSGMGVFSSTI